MSCNSIICIQFVYTSLLNNNQSPQRILIYKNKTIGNSYIYV